MLHLRPKQIALQTATKTMAAASTQTVLYCEHTSDRPTFYNDNNTFINSDIGKVHLCRTSFLRRPVVHSGTPV